MMTILFYQLNGKFKELQEWKQGKYFGHTLFGATHFPNYNIKVIMFKPNRLDIFFSKLAKLIKIDFRLLSHTLRILVSDESFDVVYAPYPRGLQLLILLRSFGIYKKKILIYGHRTIETSTNPIVRYLLRLFYEGVDKVLFFSDTHYIESKENKICKTAKLHKINWGPDLKFYDTIRKGIDNISPSESYVSIGKSRRDYSTLVRAFIGKNSRLNLYVDSTRLKNELESNNPNISISYLPVSSNSPMEIVPLLVASRAVAICTKKVKGLNGITNLYEAMAMNKPVIITRNKYIDIDVEKEKIGIAVDVEDTSGWKSAIDFFDNNPELAIEYGNRGRLLCEKKFNLDLYSKEVAEILLTN